MSQPQPEHPFRFFDNRGKYLLFVTTTSEKQAIAARVGQELTLLEPRPPALRLFDAGMGDGTVLMRVLRHLHRLYPTGSRFNGITQWPRVMAILTLPQPRQISQPLVAGQRWP